MNGNVSWASAKERSARVNGYPSYQSTNKGFFGRFGRKLSMSLPFAHGGQEERIAEKQQQERGRSGAAHSRAKWSDVPRRIALLLARRRKLLAGVLTAILITVLFWAREYS
jgi:mannan polymerase II complex MNN10 subunit